MAVNELLQSILKSQALDKTMLDDLSNHRQEVEENLRDKYGDEPTIRYGGSKAKGTMIKESYDLDIVCYFPRDCDMDIEEIYNDVHKKLSETYSIVPKTSALRIQKKDEDNVDYHIDVVPGRFIDEKEQDTFLYVAKGKEERIKTNLDTHIKVITKSGCADIIKLGKLWKVRNKVNLRTFILELLVLKAMEDSKSKSDHKSSFVKLLEYLRDEISEVRLEDPANSNNVVSDNWTSAERSSLSAMASSSLSLIEKDEDDVDSWKKVFNETSPKAEYSPSTIIVKNPSKPWSY